jgi:hypothetical protein
MAFSEQSMPSLFAGCLPGFIVFTPTALLVEKLIDDRTSMQVAAMIFWFVYALILLLATWFFAVSAFAVWRQSHPRSAKPLPKPSARVELDLICLEAQFTVAPVTALDEAHHLKSTLHRSQKQDLQAVSELIHLFEVRVASDPTVRVRR